MAEIGEAARLFRAEEEITAGQITVRVDKKLNSGFAVAV
jgi:hypothetical protein